MEFVTLFLACLALIVPLPVVSSFDIPSPSSIDSDITLLYYNDLDSYTSSEHNSTLLLSPKTEASAMAACEALAETLLPVNETFFTLELVYSLRYLTYEGAFPESQLYYVASSGSTCQAVDTQGAVSSVSCDAVLPALCSQSAAIGAAAEPTNSLTVSANNLTITGYYDQASFRFEGIPYANPPERFTYSTMYSGNPILNATAYGPECIQSGVPPPYGSEDCLFLNIYTPYIPQDATTSTGLKPVMFWIHGGAFTSGAGSQSDGGNMASRGDVVIVTINYRLSTLGFLALEDGETNGNFGIADQILALDWVRQYIVAFGGDPSRITIFGQSAGAGSVRAMLGSEQTIGKFAGAIPMSNLAGSDYATTYSLYYTIPEEVYVAVDPILAEINCTTTNVSEALTCLKTYDAYSLVTLENVARYIVVDETIITTDELVLNGTGHVARVQLMMGNMRDDGAAFIGYTNTTNLTAALEAQYLPTGVANNYLFEPYPAGPNATLDVFNVTARAATDVEFRCLDQATAWSGVTHDLFESVWYYQFNRSYQTPGFSPNYPVCEAPVTAEYPYGDPSQEYFKCHSGEVMYVWGGLGGSDTPYRDDEDLPFMQRMVDIWTSFARTYNPNPDTEYLTVRGYNNTLAAAYAEQSWEQVTESNFYTSALRTLQWTSINTGFAEQPQCDYFDYPLSYYG